jgi:hypothetical protein
MTPEQEAAERAVIFQMLKSLEELQEAGHFDWQVLTSFLANLLIDHDNPQKMLKRLITDVKFKLSAMRQLKMH